MKKFAPRVKIPTPDMLANAAVRYLGRYASSEASLRRVLQNRLQRSKIHHPAFADDIEKQNQLRSAIETIIKKYRESGALNDSAFADTKIQSLRRAGRSQRAIQQMLGHKGVKQETIRQALFRHDKDTDAEETELKAALALARRRRLGPFRSGASDAARTRKDIAALARAGFSIDIARKVLVWKEEQA